MKPSRSPQAHRSELPFGTLGKLADQGYRLFGWCPECARTRYPPPGDDHPTEFEIDLTTLIAEHGRDYPFLKVPAVPCPTCGSKRTEYRLLPPQKGAGDVMRHSANDGISPKEA
jgi:hypothetical protein